MDSDCGLELPWHAMLIILQCNQKIITIFMFVAIYVHILKLIRLLLEAIKFKKKHVLQQKLYFYNYRR